MKIGDKVRVIGVPEDYLEVAPAETVAVFHKSLGGTFVIEGFNDIGWAEIVVQAATGKTCETIWLEPESLELIEN